MLICNISHDFLLLAFLFPGWLEGVLSWYFLQFPSGENYLIDFWAIMDEYGFVERKITELKQHSCPIIPRVFAHCWFWPWTLGWGSIHLLSPLWIYSFYITLYFYCILGTKPLYILRGLCCIPWDGNIYINYLEAFCKGALFFFLNHLPCVYSSHH